MRANHQITTKVCDKKPIHRQVLGLHREHFVLGFRPHNLPIKPTRVGETGRIVKVGG